MKWLYVDSSPVNLLALLMIADNPFRWANNITQDNQPDPRGRVY